MSIIKKITEVTVLPNGEPIFCERAIRVRVEDDAAGEFIVLESDSESYSGKVAIDSEDWPVLKEVIEQMMGELR